MTEPTDEELLAGLAAELAELLRFEHDAGAIGIVDVGAPSMPPRALGPRSAELPAASRSEAVTAPPAPPRPRAAPPAAPPALAPSLGEVDALLAAARRARSPARAEPSIRASEERVTVPEPRPVPAPSAAALSSAAPAAATPAAATPAPSLARPASRSSDGRLVVLADLAREAAACTACRLHESRTQSVFARGSADAEIVFVGEGPGFNEDKQGEPFVGAAGQLLDKMIAAMGLSRDGVYVCNVVKCRPPENRTPLPDESAACGRFLDGQLSAIQPRVIVALGRCAAERLGCAEHGRSWRGAWGEHRGVPVMPTYHPAYLLRNADMKRPVWEDLQKVVARLAKGTAATTDASPADDRATDGERS